MPVAVKTSAYQEKAIFDLVTGVKLDGIVHRDYLSISPTNRGKEAVFTLIRPQTADTTPISSALGARDIEDPDQATIKVAMQLYGNKAIAVTGEHMLWGTLEPDQSMQGFVDSVVIGAQRTLNALALAALKELPDSDTTWEGPDEKDYNPITDLLRYNGTAVAGSKATRVLITSSDVFGDDTTYIKASTMLKRVKRILDEKGNSVEGANDGRFMDYQGSMYYACYLHPRVMEDIKKDADFKLDRREVIFQDTLASGKINVYEGFAFVEDASLVYSGEGAGSINVYPIIFAAKKYLLKAALPVAQIQRNKNIIEEPMELTGTGVEIRHVNGGDASGISTNLVWVGYLGYGLGIVDAGMQWEVATSAG